MIKASQLLWPGPGALGTALEPEHVGPECRASGGTVWGCRWHHLGLPVVPFGAADGTIWGCGWYHLGQLMVIKWLHRHTIADKAQAAAVT